MGVQYRGGRIRADEVSIGGRMTVSKVSFHFFFLPNDLMAELRWRYIYGIGGGSE